MGFGIGSVVKGVQDAVKQVGKAVETVAKTVEKAAGEVQQRVADVSQKAIDAINGRDSFEHGPVAEMRDKSPGPTAHDTTGGPHYV